MGIHLPTGGVDIQPNKHSKMKLLAVIVGFAILSLALAAPGTPKERRSIDWNDLKNKVQQGLFHTQQQIAQLNVQGHLDKAQIMAKDTLSQLNVQGHMEKVRSMAKKTLSQANVQEHLDNARNMAKETFSRVDMQSLRQNVQGHLDNAKSWVSNVDYNSFRSKAQNLFNSLTSGF